MSKTFTAKIYLDDEQILEVIAAYFGVSRNKVVVDIDWQGIEIEKEIEVPEQAKPDYIPIPVNPPHNWWNDDWWKKPIIHKPVGTWCISEATTITGGKAITDVTFGDQEDWKKTVIDDFGGD